MSEFIRILTMQYIVFVTLGCLGVLQLAGARASSRRLCLLPNFRASALFGVVLLVVGYAFFFSRAQYLRVGLEGAQLFAYFGVSATLALLICLGVHTVRSGQVGTARHRIAHRVYASLAELKPLLGRPTRYRTEDEAG